MERFNKYGILFLSFNIYCETNYHNIKIEMLLKQTRCNDCA